MIYVDSSVLLELYFGQPRADDARALLTAPGPKVSSWLLAVEVPTVLRRAGADESWVRDALGRFDADVAALSLYGGLPEVARRIRLDARFARCRSLDAIHGATALLVQEQTDHSVTLATFDARLAALARTLPLGVAFDLTG